MNNKEFADKMIDIADNYKTLYILGCFGAPMNAKNKKRYTNNQAYNAARADMINAATDDTFGFDCVGLIKGVLWGWCGDKTRTYGGATYESNDVPDIGADTMYERCNNKSEDFSKIKVGEVVWLKGHIGVYIGGGLAVECTPKWGNDVQVTAVGNIIKETGYDTRTWTAHGELPYIEYLEEEKPVEKMSRLDEVLDSLHKLGSVPAEGLQAAALVEIAKTQAMMYDLMKGDK